MPPGRFVSSVTPTPVGEVTAMGICIPWFRVPDRDPTWE